MVWHDFSFRVDAAFTPLAVGYSLGSWIHRPCHNHIKYIYSDSQLKIMKKKMKKKHPKKALHFLTASEINPTPVFNLPTDGPSHPKNPHRHNVTTGRLVRIAYFILFQTHPHGRPTINRITGLPWDENPTVLTMSLWLRIWMSLFFGDSEEGKFRFSWVVSEVNRRCLTLKPQPGRITGENGRV